MNCIVPAIALVSALTLASAGPASAHAHLLSATPAEGTAAAKAPTEIVLHFSEGITLAFTGISLTNEHKTGIPLGAAGLGPGGDAKTLVVPVPKALPPGLYTVDWHALATDGHKTDGQYVFTVQP